MDAPAIDTFTVAMLAILALLVLGGPAPADDMPLLHVGQGGGAGHLGALAPAQLIRPARRETVAAPPPASKKAKD
jgi:hypothetical protein